MLETCKICKGEGKEKDKYIARSMDIRPGRCAPYDYLPPYTIYGKKCDACNGTGEYSPIQRFAEVVPKRIVIEALNSIRNTSTLLGYFNEKTQKGKYKMATNSYTSSKPTT